MKQLASLTINNNQTTRSFELWNGERIQRMIAEEIPTKVAEKMFGLTYRPGAMGV